LAVSSALCAAVNPALFTLSSICSILAQLSLKNGQNYG
jgi:hypothetical protein